MLTEKVKLTVVKINISSLFKKVSFCENFRAVFFAKLSSLYVFITKKKKKKKQLQTHFMFADSALSSCLLLLASGSCIYLVGKRSTDNFSNFPPEILAASIGTLAINFRSLFNLLSPFFFHNSYCK